MTLEELTNFLQHKRDEHLEFFECKTGFDYRLFDTVCAFLNTMGTNQLPGSQIRQCDIRQGK
jgi:hypothetical protein